MPLTAVDFFAGGPIKAADHNQFYNLFTGAMTDQPVTFANILSVGGSQSIGSTVLKLAGVAGQTASMIDLRTLAADAQPVFSVDKTGKISWGPGGGSGVDITLTRTAVGLLTLTGALAIAGQVTINTGTYNLPTVVGNAGLWHWTKAWGGSLVVTPFSGQALVGPGETAARAANATYTSPNGESISWYCDGTNWYAL